MAFTTFMLFTRVSVYSLYAALGFSLSNIDIKLDQEYSNIWMNHNNTTCGSAQSGWLPWLHLYGRNRNRLIGSLPSLSYSPSLFTGFLSLHLLGSETKPPHSSLFASNCDRFCSRADANETGLFRQDGEAAPSHVSLWPQDVDVYCRLGPYYIPSAT